jgi:organic hydroperoxide reductase OsmC/OhrA
MPTAPFPHRYVVSLADGELTAPPRAPIPAGAPPQFGGSDRVWSPEELLVGSVLLCVQTTFDAYARRASLKILDWDARATGTLVKSSGGPSFSSIDIDVRITTAPGDEARATDLLQTAERHCIISNALDVPVHVHVKTTTAGSAATG